MSGIPIRHMSSGVRQHCRMDTIILLKLPSSRLPSRVGTKTCISSTPHAKIKLAQ